MIHPLEATLPAPGRACDTFSDGMAVTVDDTVTYDPEVSPPKFQLI
jgi:hypothetical protein